MELADVLAAIGSGEFDGRLEEIAAAMVDRARSVAVEFAWKLDFDGDEWTEETVTLGELKFVESQVWVDGIDPDTGRPWRRRATRVDLDPQTRADHALALIVAHLHKAQGVPLGDAVKRAEAVTAAELEGIVGEYERVRPPKDGSAPPVT